MKIGLILILSGFLLIKGQLEELILPFFPTPASALMIGIILLILGFSRIKQEGRFRLFG